MYDAFHLNYRTNYYPVINLNKTDFDEIIGDLKYLAKYLATKETPWKIANIKTRLILLLINSHLDRKNHDIRNTKTGNFPNIANQFKILLEQHIQETRSVNFYSQQLGISSNYLSTVCSEIFGKSVKVIINQRITLEAKRLLLGTDTPVREIAVGLGFPSLANFSSFIKLNTGISPSEYRKKGKKNLSQKK